MHHLENIQKLFRRNFVESPLLETYEAGNIMLPAGRLVACDPLLTNNMKPFVTDFPKGSFPVNIHRERDSGCIAYVEIVFSSAEVKNWKMATTEGQITEDLKDGEIFGYPVESGMGCFMDAETQDDLNRLEIKLFRRKGDDFMGIYEEFFHGCFFDSAGAANQYAFLKPDENKHGNICAFETGYGEGFYASYIGFDEAGRPAKVVSEFIEILTD